MKFCGHEVFPVFDWSLASSCIINMQMWPIVTDGVAWSSVGLSFSLSWLWILQKWLCRSRCCLESGLRWVQNMYLMGCTLALL